MSCNIRKPDWLLKKKDISLNHDMKKMLREFNLHTVCESAACPNISECFSENTATFMVLGDVCTRACKFCGVQKVTNVIPEIRKANYPGSEISDQVRYDIKRRYDTKHAQDDAFLHLSSRPTGEIFLQDDVLGGFDSNEAKNIVEVIKKLKLQYVVLTMVTRDDLPDGGAGHLVNVVKQIKKDCKDVLIEVLTSDFYCSENYKNLLKFKVNSLFDAGVNVFGHNVETVERLYPIVRSNKLSSRNSRSEYPGSEIPDQVRYDKLIFAEYKRSLKVLETIKKGSDSRIVKTGIMLGLGETEEEIKQTLKDIYNTGCDILTIGQYLMPSRKHYPLTRYVNPEEFEQWKKYAYDLGFKAVESGPFVRSSYKAKELFGMLKYRSFGNTSG